MTIKLNKTQTLELRGLAACGVDGTFWPVKEADKFASLGVVEVAKNVTNDDGEVAVRINDAGKAYLATIDATGNNTNNEENSNKGVDTGNGNAENGTNTNAGNEASAETKKTPGVKPAMSFAIESNVALPQGAIRTGHAVYPFEHLEIGQSFFVPATADKPEPHVSLASTVASANKRYAVEIPGVTRLDRKKNEVPATYQTRKFIVKKMVEQRDGVDVTGARVWRIEVPASEAKPAETAAE